MISYEFIKSRSNPHIKLAASLATKKGRDAAGLFIAEGVKLCIEALNHRLPIKYLFVSEDNKEQIFNLISSYEESISDSKVKVYTVSSSVFEKISTEKAPQGIIAVIKHLDFLNIADIIYKEEFFSNEHRIVALESVRDPSNLGSIIRSAVAFGITHIVLSHDCADLYNPKTIRASMGGVFKIKACNVVMTDFVSAVRDLGRRVFAAELRSNSISILETKLSSTDIVIIGNEGHGISPETSNACDASMFIPIAENTESLNASVAASIIMWELSKY